VSNARRYAGLLRLAHDARLDDGRLEIYLFPTGSTVELAVAFARGFLGRLPGGAVKLRHGRRVTVESDEATPVPWQIDGDAGGVTPVEIELAPYQHRLVVP
jgi:diacylglycerol kinase family enzyme